RREPRPPRPCRQITLDAVRLAQAGILTPETRSTRLVEEFRIIKRPLLLHAFAASDEPTKNANVIMVTSARPGEGKSFVACNLAMRIASERDIKVVLIDGDCQNPAMPRIFGLDFEKGFFDLLADPGLDLADVMLQTNFRNLAIIPGGRGRGQGPSESTELLASARMS